MNETVTISKAEYDQLKRDQFWARCLDSAGVDNWDGNEIAMKRFRKKYPDGDEDLEDED